MGIFSILLKILAVFVILLLLWSFYNIARGKSKPTKGGAMLSLFIACSSIIILVFDMVSGIETLSSSISDIVCIIFWLSFGLLELHKFSKLKEEENIIEIEE